MNAFHDDDQQNEAELSDNVLEDESEEEEGEVLSGDVTDDEDNKWQ